MPNSEPKIIAPKRPPAAGRGWSYSPGGYAAQSACPSPRCGCIGAGTPPPFHIGGCSPRRGFSWFSPLPAGLPRPQFFLLTTRWFPCARLQGGIGRPLLLCPESSFAVFIARDAPRLRCADTGPGYPRRACVAPPFRRPPSGPGGCRQTVPGSPPATRRSAEPPAWGRTGSA